MKLFMQAVELKLFQSVIVRGVTKPAALLIEQNAGPSRSGGYLGLRRMGAPSAGLVAPPIRQKVTELIQTTAHPPSSHSIGGSGVRSRSVS